ncbi:uncharacterized protein LOC114016815 [Falco cherrug]|uniref:uncharacterized protein LOC114016815 n=1 Tax=Falco cherrug TaxID=345164 RepID=UPI0024792BEE|nr:uncharacterized protein LOC114016815 [Falco cherrug]
MWQQWRELGLLESLRSNARDEWSEGMTQTPAEYVGGQGKCYTGEQPHQKDNMLIHLLCWSKITTETQRLYSARNSSFETPGCAGYCGAVTASDVSATHRTIHHEKLPCLPQEFSLPVLFKTSLLFGTGFGHLKICLSFSAGSDMSLANLRTLEEHRTSSSIWDLSGVTSSGMLGISATHLTKAWHASRPVIG